MLAARLRHSGTQLGWIKLRLWCQQHMQMASSSGCSEYSRWLAEVEATAHARPEAAVPCVVREVVPILDDVDPLAHRLEAFAVPPRAARQHTVASSFLEVRYPLSTDRTVRRMVRDHSPWNSFRYGKWLEAVDALTGDVAYRHAKQTNATTLKIVTGGHFRARKLRSTDMNLDVSLRCYITRVGKSSMEVRTDAVQTSQDGQEHLLNVCHTIMVALDTATMRPTALPALVNDDSDASGQAKRLALANMHETVRKERRSSSVFLREKNSRPPHAEEMGMIHSLHQRRVRALDDPDQNAGDSFTMSCDHRHVLSQCIYDEGRNCHGNVFGGYIAREGCGIAFYAARRFIGDVPITLGIDEAVFSKPVSIGDMVRFTAQVVHTAGPVVRVTVLVDVLNETDKDGGAKRTNFLSFVFLAPKHVSMLEVVPDSYAEVLLHVDAARNYLANGPSPDMLDALQ